jgi:hypothetical protein
LIAYEEIQIAVADRVTVSASNKKDAWWRLALQSKNQDMALVFISGERRKVHNQK